MSGSQLALKGLAFEWKWLGTCVGSCDNFKLNCSYAERQRCGAAAFSRPAGLQLFRKYCFSSNFKCPKNNHGPGINTAIDIVITVVRMRDRAQPVSLARFRVSGRFYNSVISAVRSLRNSSCQIFAPRQIVQSKLASPGSRPRSVTRWPGRPAARDGPLVTIVTIGTNSLVTIIMNNWTIVILVT